MAWTLAALAGAGLAVAIAVRDAWPLLDLLYYAVPPPVAAVLLVAAAVLFAASRRRLSAMLSILLAASAVAWWLPAQFVSAPCRQADGAVRLVFWNAARGHGGWERITDAILRQDADLVCLVESGYHRPDPKTYWRRAAPGYSVSIPGRGMAILARGEIEDVAVHRIDAGSYFTEATVRLAEGSIRVVLVDLEASLWTSRRDRLARVRDALAERTGPPTLVAGDFNTPTGSTGFDGLRARFTNLWEARGDGYSATWPEPVPILTLDQIWLSPEIQPLCAHRRSTGLSDHSLLVGEVLLGDAGSVARRPGGSVLAAPVLW